MADQSDVDLDSIIDRLLEVRGSRPGKQVQLLESEIRYLCTKAREIFISQPILLELEAPIKVDNDPLCVALDLARNPMTHETLSVDRYAATFTVNTTISFVFLNTVASRPKRTICSSETTSTVASNRSRLSAFYSRTRSSIPKTSSSFAVTTSARRSTVSMASMMSASGGITSNFGRHSPTASTACLLRPSSMRRFSPCTVA